MTGCAQILTADSEAHRLMRMPDVTSFIARSIQGAAQSAVPGSASVRNGWGRIGIAVSVLVVIAAGIVLYHILRDIEWSLVGRAIRSTPSSDIALAACFVAAGYVTLTFYDFFSLRTIGRHHVPYRIAAMASFTSYSIGHNLGATVFTAGAVRWRIYSAWDLSLIDVAKMAFVTGLTFWLGNIVVLGFCLLLVPEAAGAVDQLPPLANQAIGAFGLAVIGGYVLWLSKGERAIGRGSWAIVLPNAPLTLAADRHRRARSRRRRACDLYAAAGRAGGRFHHRAGDLCHRNIARLSQPRAGQPRRVRGRGADRAAAILQGGIAGLAADLPLSLFRVCR